MWWRVAVAVTAMPALAGDCGYDEMPVVVTGKSTWTLNTTQFERCIYE